MWATNSNYVFLGKGRKGWRKAALFAFFLGMVWLELRVKMRHSPQRPRGAGKFAREGLSGASPVWSGVGNGASLTEDQPD